jgi:hypothetical protein
MRIGVKASVAAVASAAAVVLFAPAEAQAVGTCSLSIPSTVRISSPYQAVTGRLSSNCTSAGVVYASWELYHPTQGSQYALFFDHSSSDVWNLYDSYPLGVSTWRPDYGYNANYSTVATQNSPTTDVRVGSGAAIYTSRSGSYVTITASSSRYDNSLSQWIRWGNIQGTIQYYSSVGWSSFKYAYQNSNGYYTYRFYSPHAGTYRVLFPSTSTVWGSVSASSYR